MRIIRMAGRHHKDSATSITMVTRCRRAIPLMTAMMGHRPRLGNPWEGEDGHLARDRLAMIREAAETTSGTSVQEGPEEALS